MNQNNNKTSLRDYFINECGLESSELKDNSSIFIGGLLDSMDVMQLIAHLENDYQLSINPLEVSLEQLDSINSISDFIQKKHQ